ncbi:phosphotransferase family protein [Sphingobium sp. BYY-5]|uniref:phosphotransferase family protein n=1 Tax=Sphingobium sp. BYY-5 TaxID=2926400 RepID=UPI001FA7D4A5|nr:phosphotransferase family protein [Sphingobium sp. BYY-5]
MPNHGISDTLDDFGGLINWENLNAWLDTSGAPGYGPVTAARKLAGGLQNNVFLLSRGNRDLILRRPGKHLKPRSNETMLREARVLNALEGSAVPHPRMLALCDDADVLGACFYLMEPLEGFARSGDLPGQYATDSSWRRAMGVELVKAASALGNVDPVAAGLEDLGRPDNWHERQVERWRSQLEGYAATPGYNPADLPHVDAVGRWLADNLPTDRRIGLVHGDLQFPNVMFSLQAPRISGVLDWELVSLGDPLLDLGWILSSWFEDGDPEGKSPMVKPWDGFLSRGELSTLYGKQSGRDMAQMPWFFALACYKLACLLEATFAASKAGKVPEPVGRSVHAYATWLMTKALQIIAG